MVLSARQEVIRQKMDRRKQLRRLKADLARSVLLRVHEELEEHPETEVFSSPLLKDGEVPRYLLRNHPDEIAAKIALGRTVELSLDESIEPPEVVITLGAPLRHE